MDFLLLKIFTFIKAIHSFPFIQCPFIQCPFIQLFFRKFYTAFCLFPGGKEKSYFSIWIIFIQKFLCIKNGLSEKNSSKI